MTAIKFKEDDNINPPLDDFSSLENIKEILLRD
jgi:hypothetical protein